MAEGEAFSPRDQYYYANELRDHAINEEACKYYELFLAGGQGWIEDNFQACLRLAECRERLGIKTVHMKHYAERYSTINHVQSSAADLGPFYWKRVNCTQQHTGMSLRYSCHGITIRWG